MNCSGYIIYTKIQDNNVQNKQVIFTTMSTSVQITSLVELGT